MLRSKQPKQSHASQKQKQNKKITKNKKSIHSNKKVHQTQKRTWLTYRRTRYSGPMRSADEMYPLYPLTPINNVPDHIPRPDYVGFSDGQPTIKGSHIPERKTREQIETMRHACQVASYIREFAGKQVRPGITLAEIDDMAHEEMIRLGAYPSTLGYCGFKKSLAASVNNVICHGIPDQRKLIEGDIVNLDITCFVDGYHGDCSGMFVAGKTDAASMQLIDATWTAMNNAIAICRPGQKLSAIGKEVQLVADAYGYGVVPEFCGHGIGKQFHMQPQIFHCANNYPGTMEEGMTFTIEPILNATPYSEIVRHHDGWAILTVDGARSAQFEQTIAITKEGAEVLTQHQPGYFDKKM